MSDRWYGVPARLSLKYAGTSPSEAGTGELAIVTEVSGAGGSWTELRALPCLMQGKLTQ